MSKTLIFSADLYLAVFQSVSTEETRYYLQGVLIEPHAQGGVVMMATDGHKLLCAHDPKGQATEAAIVRLPPDALKACKSGKTEVRTVSVSLDGDVAIIQTSSSNAFADHKQVSSFHGVLVDGIFLDWRRVVPRGPFDRKTTPAFDTKYVTAMAKAGDMLAHAFRVMSDDTHYGRAPITTMQVHFQDADSPALVRWSGAGDAFGVLMPVRSEDLCELPSFVDSSVASPDAEQQQAA